MSTLRSAIVTILVLVIAVVLAIFAVENLSSVSAAFAGMRFTLPLWWVAIGSAILGFIMATLVTLPGRLATGWRARSLAREHQNKDSAIDELRNDHERLVAENTRLRTERDQLRARLDDYGRSAQAQPFVQAEPSTEPAPRSGYPATYDERMAQDGRGFERPSRGYDESLPDREESGAAPPRR
jgi:uncharacterized integral membrane protein